MDIDSLILILLIILIPLAGLTMAFFILRWIFKKGIIGKVICLSITLFIVYSIISAIWPPDSFYKGEFELRSSLTFPKSANIIYKKSTYPDFHGDYTSEAIFTLSEDEFSNLKVHLEKNWNPETEKPWTPKHNIMNQEILYWENMSEEIDDHFSWGLMKDGKTAFFKFVQT